jgi:multidrug efflux pump subunit AcrA (membrane-fusion protein)
MVALMNTFAIYEQFRAVLGEDAAKGFAQTLGTMFEEARNAATKDDVRILRESMSADVSRLEGAMTNLAQAQARTEFQVKELAQAQARTESRIEELAQAQARTESRIEELAQAQARTESRIEELAQAQARTESRIEELSQAQAGTESQVEKLANTMTSFSTILNQLVIRSDRHEGKLLELGFRDRLPAYLGRFLRKGQVIQASDLLDQIEPTLAEAAVDDFLRADVVAAGMVEGKPTYLVGEVSYTVDADDVMRAARRAACLVKAGLPAIPLVACEKISPQTTAYARQEGVRIWVDGSLLDA